MPLRMLARHAHSTLNQTHRVNGDPSVVVPLTDLGRQQAERLGLQLAHVPLDLIVHTRFGRTADTAEAVLRSHPTVSVEVEPLLDDIDVGDLDGLTVEEYRTWKRAHGRGQPFPGGESLDDAARRYVEAFRRLAARPQGTILVVCHEIPVRYALNAAAGSEALDAPVHDVDNAVPFLFDGSALVAAAARIEELVGPPA